MIELYYHAGGFLLSAAIYLGIVGWLAAGFRKSQRTILPNVKEHPPVTVIVAAHNEEDNLPSLLAALGKQIFPAERLHIIVIDDRSSDSTGEVATEWQDTIPHLELLRIDAVPDGVSPKKFALHAGIAHSTTEYLIFTDADCQPEPRWVEGMVSLLKERDVVAGFAPLKAKEGFVPLYAAYESLRTNLLMHGAIARGIPYMTSGRSWGYRKSAYERSGGLEPLYTHLGGDDDLLFQAMLRSGVSVGSCLAPETAVYSSAPKSFGQLARQKMRHYSVSSSYNAGSMFWLLVLQLAPTLCLYVVISAFFMITPFHGLLFVAAMLKLAMLVSGFTGPLARAASEQPPGIRGIAYELYHVLFSSVSGIASFILKPKW